MKSIHLVALLATSAVTLCPVQARAAITVEEVIELDEHGVDPAELLRLIKEDGSTFQLSVDDVLRLKQSGVSGEIINYMLSSRAGATDPAPLERLEPAPSLAPPTAAPARDEQTSPEASVHDGAAPTRTSARPHAASVWDRRTAAQRELEWRGDLKSVFSSIALSAAWPGGGLMYLDEWGLGAAYASAALASGIALPILLKQFGGKKTTGIMLVVGGSVHFVLMASSALHAALLTGTYNRRRIDDYLIEEGGEAVGAPTVGYDVLVQDDRRFHVVTAHWVF